MVLTCDAITAREYAGPLWAPNVRGDVTNIQERTCAGLVHRYTEHRSRRTGTVRQKGQADHKGQTICRTVLRTLTTMYGRVFNLYVLCLVGPSVCTLGLSCLADYMCVPDSSDSEMDRCVAHKESDRPQVAGVREPRTRLVVF